MRTDEVADLIRDVCERVILPRFRALASHEVIQKRPGDVVTVADREAEAELTAAFGRATPGALVVGEEASFADPTALRALPDAEHAWVVDPVDGTRNFAAGTHDFGVMVAEVRRGEATRGWIWQPQFGRGYVVERGAGVRVNGEPLVHPVRDRKPLGGTSKKNLLGYDADGQLSPAVRSHFSAAFDYPAVLEGDFDFAVYTNTWPWDHLAGSLMLTEVGGVSRTLDGMAYSVLTRAKGLLVAGDTVSWLAAQQYWPVN